MRDGSRVPRLAFRLIMAVAVAVSLRVTTTAGAALLHDLNRIAAVDEGGRMPTADLAAGTFLIASRELGDRNFVESVVLLFAYSPTEGAGGLIINRRTTLPVGRALPDLPIPRGPEPFVYAGGPVGPNELRGLLRSAVAEPNAYRVLPDVALLTSVEALERAVAAGATADRLHLYLGYAGWSPGQLEAEVARGHWRIAPGDGSVVFAPDPNAVWRRQILRTDVLTV